MIVNRNTLLANHILKSNSRNEKKNSQKPNERAFKPHTLQRCSHKNTSLIRECYCCVYLSLYYYYIFFCWALWYSPLRFHTQHLWDCHIEARLICSNVKYKIIRYSRKKKKNQHNIHELHARRHRQANNFAHYNKR